MLKKDILSLADIPGVTGNEDAVAEAVYERLLPLVAEARIDGQCNVIGRIPREGTPRLMISAHLDQIGLMITRISDEGFAEVAAVGGIDPRTLLGGKFLVLGEKETFHAYSAAMPPHLQKAGDDEKAVSVKDIRLDLGMSGEEARKLIAPGTPVVFDVKSTELLNNRITGAALDDRAGVACILEMLRRLQGRELPCDLTVLFASMEESNHQGCAAAVQQLRPDYMIAVDVCHAATLGSSEQDRVHVPGCGAVIAFGMNSVPAFAGRIAETAQRHNIPYDREALPGNTYTDAWCTQTSNEGVCTAVVSMPLRHMHTPAEVLDMQDAEAVCALLTAFAGEFGGLCHE